MDLELTDEQTMLGEALTTLLEREWLPPESAHTATPEQRARLWSAVQEFFDAELGAVELCLVARALGAHLASTPFLGSAALRFAAEPFSDDVPAAFGDLGEERVSVALLEPGRSWSVEGTSTLLGLTGLDGHKVAVEHAEAVDRFAVVASGGGRPALALVSAHAPGTRTGPQPALDVTVPMHAVTFSGAMA